jgi:hypothetical protein
MAGIENHDMVLHHIRAKLYPNHLQNVEGNYIARTDTDRTLGVKDVCTAAKTRGGYPGDINEMLNAVEWYNSELAYQVCDGYAVSNDWFTIYPHISGTFESPHDAADPEKHKVSARLSVRKRFRDSTKNTAVSIDGLADTNGFIDFLMDQESKDAGHNVYLPGDMITIYGSRIKIAGDDPSNGVYFVPTDKTSPPVKMARIGENTPSKITGIASDTKYPCNRIEIRTQYNGSNNTFLKEPRVITSFFTMEII